MSPLAFDKQGRPFPFHRRTRKLLVRLFRNPAARGTCCQVLDAAGEPLFVDVETEYLEFRKLVGNVPGLYRLDQCDEDGIEIEDAPPAYVSIDTTRNASMVDGGGDVNPLVIIEHLVAIQADVMKTMAAQQAALISASAEILRAPYRPALPAVASEKDREDKDKDDECDDCKDANERDDETPEDPWAALRPMMDMIEPHVPKLGAFLYEQFIAFIHRSKAQAAPSPAASPPAAAPAPSPASAPAAAPSAASWNAEPTGAAAGPSSPSSDPHMPPAAPATPAHATITRDSDDEASGVAMSDEPADLEGPTGESEDRDDGAEPVIIPTATAAPALITSSQAPASAPTVVPGTATPRAATSSGIAPTRSATPRAATSSSIAPTAPQPPRNALPTPTPAQVMHLYQIRAQLSPEERAIAENAISRMPSDVLVQWLGELSAMSVDEATNVLRQMIARIRAPRPGGRG